MTLIDQTIFEGIGNELLYVMSFFGLLLFVVIAWMSTGVNWDAFRMRVTLIQVERERDQQQEQSETVVETLQSVAEPSSVLQGVGIVNGNEDPGSVSDASSLVDTVVEQDDGKQEESCSSYPLSEKPESPGDESCINADVDDASSNVESSTVRYRSKNTLNLKLQFIDGQTRTVSASPDMSIDQFKKKFFHDEIVRQKKQVRLIFGGRELTENNGNRRGFINQGSSSNGVTLLPADSSVSSLPSRRLRDYNVQNDSTIHCLVVQAVGENDQPGDQSSPSGDRRTGRGTSTTTDSLLTEFDMGTRIMEPLFAFLLIVTWFIRIAYRQYFNSVSTFALIALSVFFGGAVFSSTVVRIISLLLSLGSPTPATSEVTSDDASRTMPTQVSGDQNYSTDSRIVTVTMYTIPERALSTENSISPSSTFESTSITEPSQESTSPTESNQS